jgi:hypothetical protein
MGSSALYGAAIGTTSIGAGSQAAMLASQTGVFGSAGLSATAGAAGSGTMATGFSMLPVVGWIAAGMMAANSLYKSGWSADGIDTKGGLMSGGFASVVKLATNILGRIVGDRLANVLTGAPVMARLFGHKKPEITGTGLEGVMSLAGMTGIEFADWKAKGGLFRSDKSGRNTSPIGDELQKLLNDTSSDLYGAVQDYAKVLQLPVEWARDFSTTFKVVWGKTDEENKKALEDAFRGLGNSLAGVYSDSIKQFQKDGEDLLGTLERLAQIQSLTVSMAGLGGVFFKIADASMNAKDALFDLAGGIEGFVNATQTYLREYFSADEQGAMSLLSAQRILEAAGISTGGLGGSTRDDVLASFRAGVDALDPTTEEGRRQFMAYMNASGAFASGADVLSRSGMDLAAFTTGAPDGFTVQIDPMVNAQAQTNAILDDSRTILQRIYEALKGGAAVRVEVNNNSTAEAEVYAGQGA